VDFIVGQWRGQDTALENSQTGFAGGTPASCSAPRPFRAAAVEHWKSGRSGNGTGHQTKSGADPAAVVYDAVCRGQARSADVVHVDTAGRLPYKSNLMAELEKEAYAAKVIPGAPHDVLLVLDATTGQNGLAQARELLPGRRYRDLLTKLDGTARGIFVAIPATGLAVRSLHGRARSRLGFLDAETYANSSSTERDAHAIASCTRAAPCPQRHGLASPIPCGLLIVPRGRSSVKVSSYEMGVPRGNRRAESAA